MPNLVPWEKVNIEGAEKMFVCLCLQSEWFILGLPNQSGSSWGHVPTSSGTVCVYSTGIPRVTRKVYES